jgi:hypothetical protein
MRRYIWILLAIAAICLGQSASAPSVAAEPPALRPATDSTDVPSPTVAELCAQAQRLIAADKPDEAIAQIDNIRAGAAHDLTVIDPELAQACGSERREALSKSADAKLLSPEPTPEADDICEQARLFTENQQPGEALALIKDFREGAPTALANSCESDRTDALVALRAERSKAEGWSAAWTDVLTRWALPLAVPLAGFLVLVAIGLWAARLFTLLPRTPWVSPPLESRRVLRVMGLLLVSIGAAGVVVLLTRSIHLASTRGPDVLSIVFWGFLFLAGAVVLSLAHAARLAIRIEVTADGTVSTSLAVELAARLSELGSAPPRGLEIPRASDASAQFERMLPVAEKVPVAMLLRSIWSAFSDATPWIVSADLPKNGGASVVIHRNGRLIESRSINFKEMQIGIDDLVQRNVLKMIAGFVVGKLAEKHRADFEGLCGAEDWRSIGLHYIATTDLDRTTDSSLEILAGALDFDPNNRPALIALKHTLYRNAEDDLTLRYYGNWLLGQSNQLHGKPKSQEKQETQEVRESSASQDCDGQSNSVAYLNLHRRILLTYFVTVVNYRALTNQDKAHWPSSTDISTASTRLINLLQERTVDRPAGWKKSDPLPENFLTHARRQAQNLLFNLPHAATAPDEWQSPPSGGLGALAAYNVACTTPPPADPLKQQALTELLKVAFSDKDLRDRGLHDPELAKHRAHPVFSASFDLPGRQDPWELEPLASYRERLKMIGIRTAGQILGSADRFELMAYLGMPRLQYQQLLRFAMVIDAAQNSTGEFPATISENWVEIIESLLDRGLLKLPPDQPAPIWAPFVKTDLEGLARAVSKRTLRPIGLSDLTEWLTRLKAATQPVAPGRPLS